MRIVLLWSVLAIAGGAFIAMLAALCQHHVHATGAKPKDFFADAVWSLIPWIIVAVCAAPAVHRILGSSAATAVARF